MGSIQPQIRTRKRKRGTDLLNEEITLDEVKVKDAVKFAREMRASAREKNTLDWHKNYAKLFSGLSDGWTFPPTIVFHH